MVENIMPDIAAKIIHILRVVGGFVNDKKPVSEVIRIVFAVKKKAFA